MIRNFPTTTPARRPAERADPVRPAGRAAQTGPVGRATPVRPADE